LWTVIIEGRPTEITMAGVWILRRPA
jgi:hypothetical protein